MIRVGSRACLFNHDSLSFIIFLLLIDYEALFLKVEAGCTTACGKMHNIHYPFRLRNDSKHCGEAELELVCEDGEVVFYTGALKYLVSQIQYPNRSYEFGSITLRVNCSFTRNTCRLPYNSNSKFIYDSDYWPSWASFMHCSEKIENDESFCEKGMSSTDPCVWTVPSLSDENKTIYVMVGYLADRISHLPKSCMFVDTFPFTHDYFGINSSTQVIVALRKGITVPFLTDSKKESCWTSALRMAGQDIEEQYTYKFHFQIALFRFYTVFNFFQCLAYNVCHTYHENKCHIIFENITSIPVDILIVLLELAIVCKFVLPSLTVSAFLMYNCWKNTKPLDSVEIFLQKQKVLLPRRYTYGEITVMTKHFRQKLGKWGFGQVYKGELFGSYPVAVKVLEGLQSNGEDFISEVSTIGMIHHVNIVQLLGFCSEGTKYMPNGSLDRYIFTSPGNNTSFSLTIEKLRSIALGIAKGINYLHTGCDVQILHFDIKPHNVLLDGNFIPKISDFGLAKLYPKEQSLVSISAARGTIGYIAPELISRSFGVISHKSDVYSFGMLILEMAGRRRNFDTRAQNSKEVYYPSWIYDQLSMLEALKVNEITGIEELERRLCKVGLWCIQMNSSNRPTMSEVVKLLESNVDDIEMPPKPFLLSTDATTEAHTCIHSSSLALDAIVEDDNLSANDLV